MRIRVLSFVLALLLAAPVAAAAPLPEMDGEGFDVLSGVSLPYAEDVEVTSLRGRPIAVAATLPPGQDDGSLVVVDVANPRRPRTLSTIRCARAAFVDVAPTASPSLFAVFVAPDGGRCLGLATYGFALVDVATPSRPRVLSGVALEPGTVSELPGLLGRFAGSWSAAHPTKPFLYTTRPLGEQGEILAWSLSNPRAPELVTRVATATAPRSLAVSPSGAALAIGGGRAFAVYDLADPATPVLAAIQQCPGCTQTTLVSFAGDTLVVYDESLNPLSCPSGALYFYSLDGPLPLLTGAHNPSQLEPDPASPALPRMCAATDLALTPDGARALLTWDHNGVRLLDLGGTAPGATAEAGWFRLDSGDVVRTRWLTGQELIAVDRNLGLHVLRAAR